MEYKTTKKKHMTQRDLLKILDLYAVHNLNINPTNIPSYHDINYFIDCHQKILELVTDVIIFFPNLSYYKLNHILEEIAHLFLKMFIYYLVHFDL